LDFLKHMRMRGVESLDFLKHMRMRGVEN